MAGSNPFYNLVGGYYPGDPIPRNYSSGRPPPPKEFNASGIVDGYLDSIGKDLEKYSVSAQAKKFFIDDVERAFIVTSQPKSSGSYNAARALELSEGGEGDTSSREELEQFPGVALSIDLNPRKWAEDPAGMALQMGKDAVTGLINRQDLIAQTEAKLWMGILSGKIENPVLERAFGTHLDPTATNTTKPFQMFGLEGPATKVTKAVTDLEGATGQKTEQVDLFEMAGNKFLSAKGVMAAASGRDKGMRQLGDTAAQAAALELRSLVHSGHIADPEHIQAVETFAHKAKALRMANGVMNGDYAKYFSADDVVDAVTGENKSGYGFGAGAGISDVTRDLSQFSLGTLRDFNDADKNPAEMVNGTLGRLAGASKKIRSTLTESDTFFEGLSAEELAKFKRETQPLRNLLDKIDGLEKKKIDLNLPKLAQQAQANDIKGALLGFQETYARSGIIKGGLDNMNKAFIRKEMINNAAFRDAVYNNDGVVGTKNLLDILDSASDTYTLSEGGDFINTLQDQGPAIIPDYFYTRVRSRLNGFTPASVVKENLKKTHYFGLSYQSDYGQEADTAIKGVMATVLNKPANWVIEKSPISGVFDNVQTLSLDLDGTTQALKFTGNRNLKFGMDLYDRTFTDLVAPDKHLSMGQFMSLLNGDPGPGRRYQIAGHLFLQHSEAKAKLTAKHVRGWLEENAGHLLEFDADGLLIMAGEAGARNEVVLEELFKKLQLRETSQAHITVTSRKAGILDKASSKLNLLQREMFSRLMKNPTLKRALTTYVSAQEIYSRTLSRKAIGKKISGAIIARLERSAAGKALSKALAKILTTLFAAGTEGIGTVIWPIVERMIQWVINKAFDFGREFLKSLRDGGFYVIETFVDKSAQSTMKAATWVYTGIALVTVGPMLVMMLALSALTPVDPTRMGGGEYGGGPAAGPPVVCPEDTCEPIATVGCFVFLEGWTGGEGPAALPIIEAAASHLESTHGNYVDDLCAAGDIEVAWNRGAACGWAKGTNRIEFGDGQCWTYNAGNQALFTYLFAHETGHTYHNRYGLGSIGTAQSADGGALPTYKGGTGAECSSNNNDYEDFAETVGQPVAFSGRCVGWSPDFWSQYGGHYNMARDELRLSLQ